MSSELVFFYVRSGGYAAPPCLLVSVVRASFLLGGVAET